MNKNFEKLVSSIDDYTKGFSSIKLSAFAMRSCVVSLHLVFVLYCHKTGDFSLLPAILTIDFGFISALLALTTYSKLKGKNKNHESKD